MIKRWVLCFALYSSAGQSQGPPDAAACINAHVDQVIEGHVVNVSGDMFTLQVDRVLVGTYKKSLYTGTLEKISDSCSSLGPYGFQLKSGDRLLVYSSGDQKKMTPTLWLDPKTVFRFDKRLKDRFPEFEDEQDVMKRHQENDRRSLARSFGGAIPRGSTRSWVTDDDYPNTSVARGAEGLVRVRVQVNPQGRAEKCSILRSSRDVDLDAATCTNFIRRARFKPPQSNFEMQSTFEHNWRLPDEDKAGRQGTAP